MCAPRDLAPQLEEDIRQRPLVSWRLLRTPGDCAALLQPRLERAMIRLACFIYSQTHTRARARARPTEQPVFRAPQDYCFDSQGEKIVIEWTSDTCVVISWRENTGHTHTHANVSEQGRCHHNGLMSKELQGEYSGAGYTYRSVRARQEKGRCRKRGEDGRINCIHRPWVVQSPVLRCATRSAHFPH